MLKEHTDNVPFKMLVKPFKPSKNTLNCLFPKNTVRKKGQQEVRNSKRITSCVEISHVISHEVIIFIIVFDHQGALAIIDMLFFSRQSIQLVQCKKSTPASSYEPLHIHLCKPCIYMLVSIYTSAMLLWVYQLIFNEVAHNLVVEVLDGSPLDALLNVLFLREN